MLRKAGLLATLAAIGITGASLTGSAYAGTFGKVVSIGGAVSDVALDEVRGVVYVANFTANRIDVVSIATKTVQTSMNVAAQPSSLSLSPNGQWLVVAHFGNNAAPGSPANGVTLINLSANNARQTFALANPPLGVAFGNDNRALVVTTQDFILFDPVVGTIQELSTIQSQAAKSLPQPQATFPPQIVAASVAVSKDGNWIYGFGDTLIFRYYVPTQSISSTLYTSSPAMGPRAISVADDGSFAAMGWTMVNQNGTDYAEFPSPSGLLNVGGHAVDSVNGLVYSEVPTSASDAPVLTIRDADNLTLRQRLQLPEHLAGKAVLSSDKSTMYAASDSGVMILPVGNLNSAPRLQATINGAPVEDILYQGNFCTRTTAMQTFLLSDPGGAHVPFTISSAATGVRVSPSSGTTPATITVQIDPNSFATQNGTVAVQLTIGSTTGVNIPNPIRVLVNSRQPDQRGSLINVPGTLVDLMADPTKDQFYVLRQDLNQLLVFNGTNNTLIKTLRTCTQPTSMAITWDQQTLLVGCNGAHVMSTFDLSTLTARGQITTPSSYVQSLAVSSKKILAVMRDGGGGSPNVQTLDVATGFSNKLPTLGIFQNQVQVTSALTASPNGSSILLSSADGNLMLYDANVDSFTVSRKDSTALSGPHAASSFNQYVVGNQVYDSSLVSTATIQATAGSPAGFAFVDQNGLFVAAPSAADPGVIQRVNTVNGSAVNPTRMAEAPLLGNATTPFIRTVSPLFSRSEIVALTTSGVTILPWTYDSAVSMPVITKVVSAADGVSAVAPGGLMSVIGTNMSPTNVATQQLPLPTALNNSCLTVDGQPIPVIFVSSTQVNAQMPFQEAGNVTIAWHTPGGVSDNFNLTVNSSAPAIFHSATVGDQSNLPTVVRFTNGLLVTDSNPVHRGDILTIYLTGLGDVSPVVNSGDPSPFSPLSTTLTNPNVTLGGVGMQVLFSGLAPGEVGVYVLNVIVPGNAPQGLSVPLTIAQGPSTHTLNVRVVQ